MDTFGSMWVISRRALAALATPLLVPMGLPPLPASAKPFLDPASRFALDLPDGYVVSKRKATTGTLFVAGNFPRASVVSVTAWPVGALLEEDARGRDLPGLAPTAQTLRLTDSLADLGAASSVARLLLRARDREATGGALQSILDEGHWSASDPARLEFTFQTELPVNDPDGLEKERGVRRLIRRTAGAAVLGSVVGADGQSVPAVVSVWGSALEQDWDKDLKAPLEGTVQSFTVQRSGVPAA